MDYTVGMIEELAGALPAEDREMLASRLFASVHHKERNAVDDAWLSIAERRSQAYLCGQDMGISEAEFFRVLERDRA